MAPSRPATRSACTSASSRSTRTSRSRTPPRRPRRPTSRTWSSSTCSSPTCRRRPSRSRARTQNGQSQSVVVELHRHAGPLARAVGALRVRHRVRPRVAVQRAGHRLRRRHPAGHPGQRLLGGEVMGRRHAYRDHRARHARRSSPDDVSSALAGMGVVVKATNGHLPLPPPEDGQGHRRDLAQGRLRQDRGRPPTSRSPSPSASPAGWSPSTSTSSSATWAPALSLHPGAHPGAAGPHRARSTPPPSSCSSPRTSTVCTCSGRRQRSGGRRLDRPRARLGGAAAAGAELRLRGRGHAGGSRRAHAGRHRVRHRSAARVEPRRDQHPQPAQGPRRPRPDRCQSGAALRAQPGRRQGRAQPVRRRGGHRHGRSRARSRRAGSSRWR